MTGKKSTHHGNSLPDNPSRLAIFAFCDQDGIVDDYIPYLLNDLKESITDLVVVVNGRITSEGKTCFMSITPHIFLRENRGWDVAAWREAMTDYLGWDKVAEYDEVILLNDTFFGPIYPFGDVFSQMNDRPADFWGLIAHDETDGSGPLYPYGYLPQFIQSFFMVIRRSMLTSCEFKTYWENQPVYETQEEAAMLHEAVFTKYFEDAGFTWDVYIDVLNPEQPRSACVDHSRYNQFWLLSEYKCPVIRRESFVLPYFDVLGMSNGSDCRKSLEYIIQKTDYDSSMILKHILRIYHYDDIYNSLHLNYILSKSKRPKLETRSKAVVVFFIYYNQFDFLKPYICGIPENVDVILLTNRKEDCSEIDQYFSPYLGRRLCVLSGENRGREMSALFITAAPYLKEYDYIGFCHDKGPHKGDPFTKSAGFQEAIVENTIGSGPFIENVIDLLDQHPEIGFLSPPVPCYSGYFWVYLSRNWTCCFDQVQLLAQKLDLKVDISEEQWCLAAGDAYWCRREALDPLFSYPWKLDDFPPEPLEVGDGTLLHGLERIFPFVAQHQGYVSGWIMTDEFASLEITNIRFWLDYMIHHPVVKEVPVEIGLKQALINYVKRHFLKPLGRVVNAIKRLL